MNEGGGDFQPLEANGPASQAPDFHQNGPERNRADQRIVVKKQAEPFWCWRNDIATLQGGD